MPWTFTYQTIPGGTPVTKTLAAWGIGSPVLTFAHPIADFATWTMARQADFDAAVQLAPGATGLENRCWFTDPNGVVRFVGIITVPGRAAGGDSQLTNYRAEGLVGHLLKKTAYHQARQAGLYPSTTLTTVYDPQVLLGFSAAGLYQDTGAQMGDILTYAAARADDAGHAFTHSATGFPEVDILLEQAEGITCYDALLKMLAHSPDYVARVDYSTLDGDDLPEPTVRCQSRAAMAAVSRSWKSFHPINLTPSYDKLFRAVVINYHRIHQASAGSQLEIVQDIYPATLDGNPTTGREVAALSVTVPLQGSNSQTLVASVAADVINAAHATDNTRVAWWLDNYPSLRANGNLAAGLTYDGDGEAVVSGVEEGVTYFWHQGINDGTCDTGPLSSSGYFVAGAGPVTLGGTPNAPVTAFVGRITIPAATVYRTGENAYPNRLRAGHSGLAPWMGFASETERIDALATIIDDTGEREEQLSVELTATNAVSGNYSTTLVLSAGETIPAGLAENYHRAVSTLHYQGSASFAEQDMTFAVGLGNVLNVTGAEVALTTARLMIWRCTLDIANGKTTLEFGDPPTLGIGDFVDRLRALRQRKLTINPESIITGTPNGGSAANLPNTMPMDRPAKATSKRQTLVLQSSDVAVTQQVNMSLSQLPVDSVAQWRETFGSNVVEGVCTLQRCYVLRTDWENV